MKPLIIFLIALSASMIPFILYSTNAFGISLSPTITTDNTDRRMYTYCPLNNNDILSFNGEVDGCPLARVYVNNWNSLTPTQQTTIDNLLTSKGFVDAGQNPLVK